MKILSFILAALGLSGGLASVSNVNACTHDVYATSAASRLAISLPVTTPRRTDLQFIYCDSRYRGGLDWSPAKNQRIKRKNQRRASAAGSKKAFA